MASTESDQGHEKYMSCFCINKVDVNGQRVEVGKKQQGKTNGVF